MKKGMTVKEVANKTGVTVRALHHYDRMGLLHPGDITAAGYRLYGEDDLRKLQQILFFRELEFSLAEIGKILSDPSFDRERALWSHRELLLKKRRRLDRILALVEETIKGGSDVSFEEFDRTEIEKEKEKYAREAKARWGKTAQYAQSEERAKAYGKKEWEAISRESGDIFCAFADQMETDPAGPRARELVKRWQNHISAYYYDCTDEILLGLGRMYTEDERFTKNIDRYGEGLAAFMRAAIEAYCGK